MEWQTTHSDSAADAIARDHLATLRAEAEEAHRANLALAAERAHGGLRRRLGRALVNVGTALAGEPETRSRLP